jgi:two-component system, NarL family, sensor histidine kinase UhpB
MKEEVRILLLEDSALDIKVIRQVLEKSAGAFVVSAVSDKKSFVEAVTAGAFDIVVADHVLPDIDSFQALAHVRAAGAQVPFIVVTGRGDEQFAASILKEGADDYIPKKFIERLPAAILASLKRVQAEARLAASEKKFRALIENSHDIITLKDEQLNILYNSPSRKRITGWDDKASYAKNCHADDQIQMKRIMKEVLARPDDAFFSTFRVKHQKGHYIWLEGTITNKLHDPYIGAIVFNLRDVTEQIESYETLVKSEAEMRNFARHLTTVQEEERTRIAREIHDELGQQFISIKMGLANLIKAIHDESLVPLLSDLVKDVELGAQQLKKIATELRPGIIDSLGLVPSIEWLGHEFQKKSGIKCKVDCAIVEEKFEKEISNVFFRICQESLTNIIKHAQATEVSIRVYQESSQLNLMVVDNGKGIPDESASNPFSMGLLGMRERAKAIDAQLAITSRKDEGTAIHLKTNLS